MMMMMMMMMMIKYNTSYMTVIYRIRQCHIIHESKGLKICLGALMFFQS